MPGHDTELLLLTREEVITACTDIDLPGVAAEALVQHVRGQTSLPDEAYLPWTAPDGASARSLTLQAGILTDDGWVYGAKTINGCLSNPARGRARAQGVIMLFDPQTAHPVVLMEAAYISAMRTAAVTAATARALGAPELSRVALLGCGTLARAHLRLLPSVLTHLKEVALFDVNADACAHLARDLRAWRPDLTVVEAGSARACVDGAQLVVPVTTVSEGYIAHEWLAPGTLVAHVSLDDLLPEVIERADLLVIDDWSLIAADTRRVLGRMHHSGRVVAPGASVSAGTARAVDAHLGEIFAGTHPGRRSPDDIVVSNPFGMAVLDVAVAHRVLKAARAAGSGSPLVL